MGQLADQRLAGRRRLLEPRGRVDGIARDEPLPARRIAGHDLTGVDACPAGEPDAPREVELVVQAGERSLHAGRCAHGAQGIVLVQDRQAEDRHDRVADVLLDRAAVGLELGPHRVEVAGHQLAQRLGVEPLAEVGRAPQIGEDDRDGLADLPRWRRSFGRRERGAAVAAEAEAGRILLAAVRADLHAGSAAHGRPHSVEPECGRPSSSARPGRADPPPER